MDQYQLNALTFIYPTATKPALNDITLTVKAGEFITLCGQSGCGKSTFLRQFKPALTPHGEKTGEIFFEGTPLHELDLQAQTQSIGFVSQNPDNQIVTDKVWHELAFGLESLGMHTAELRTRVAEMASFFGIQGWFHKNVHELSGGQKQLINLASVMVMQPKILLLDEPTGQLDPIAAADFLETLAKINRELGTTILLSEHRLEEAFALSDRILVMDSGRIIADAPPHQIGGILNSYHHPMTKALPAASRVYLQVSPIGPCPVTVREGKDWLKEYIKDHTLTSLPADTPHPPQGEPIIELKEVFFRYKKDAPDVLKNLSLSIHAGELYAIMGGNGTGKTTALSVISGLLTPHRGEVTLLQQPIHKVKHLYQGLLGVLPQNPQTLFVKKTVREDLLELLSNETGQAEKFQNIVTLCQLDNLLDRHPYDLSGGEQQRAALAKVLLLNPKILLLDEPTKGLDAEFKASFAEILYNLKEQGVTILMVSHDVEFCAAHADRCGMFFDGSIVSEDTSRSFFAGKHFYTTAANRIARQCLPNAILTEDIVHACNGTLPSPRPKKRPAPPTQSIEPQKTEKKKNLSPLKLILGILFGIAFLLAMFFAQGKYEDFRNNLQQLLSLAFLSGCLACLIPSRASKLCPSEKRKLSKRAVIGIVMALLAIPLTIYVGMYLLDNRKYYFISLLIIAETILPFLLAFEDRKAQARELILISVLCAIIVAGRMAFYMLPQFKPMLALIIIAGVCFGGETGFLVGAVTAFVSNFFFGQGPWTPWQMFAFGIAGFLAGILFHRGFLPKNRITLCFFGGFATLFLYGICMNVSTVILYQENPNLSMFLSSIAMGLPFDLIHAAATIFFLWFAALPMMEKLERIKDKYGIS